MGREYIPSKLRFEILERDKFTCRYCGAKAPDVSLQLDHIRPVCLGGDNRKSNLITSCSSCNNAKGFGKLDYLLSEEDIKDFDENYRKMVQSYGYYTNYIKKVFSNNGMKGPSRPTIHKFTEKSFLDEYEFYLFKKELKEPTKAASIIADCNMRHITYEEYRKEHKEDYAQPKKKEGGNYESICNY